MPVVALAPLLAMDSPHQSGDELGSDELDTSRAVVEIYMLSELSITVIRNIVAV